MPRDICSAKAAQMTKTKMVIFGGGLLVSLAFAIVLQLFAAISTEPIEVRVVKKTADLQININAIDFTPISNRLLEQRANGSLSDSQFNGPELLRPLLNRCFLHEGAKYVFRVCPFANVTQHEKSQYAFNFMTNSFHAILGVWREWSIVNQRFDSLLYMHGDECEQTRARRVRVHLLCSNDWTVTELAYVHNVTEVDRCVYSVELASALFCELGSVYSHMDSQGKAEWDMLESLSQSGHLTAKGYEHYLQVLLQQYGLTSPEWDSQVKKAKVEPQVQVTTGTSEMDLCMKKVQQLEKENAELKLLLQIGTRNKTNM